MLSTGGESRQPVLSLILGEAVQCLGAKQMLTGSHQCVFSGLESPLVFPVCWLFLWQRVMNLVERLFCVSCVCHCDRMFFVLYTTGAMYFADCQAPCLVWAVNVQPSALLYETMCPNPRCHGRPGLAPISRGDVTQARVTTIQGGVGCQALGKRRAFGREPVRAQDSEKCLKRDSVSEARGRASPWQQVRCCQVKVLWYRAGPCWRGDTPTKHRVRKQEADETGSPSSESDPCG